MQERPSNWDELLGRKKHVIGTYYMGRLLISISLSQIEKLEKGI